MILSVVFILPFVVFILPFVASFQHGRRLLPLRMPSRDRISRAFVKDSALAMVSEALAANLATTDQPLGAWIPIGSVSTLEGLGPQQVMVMGVNMVVWEDFNGVWSVMTDACPHRLAPLSQGRVDPETNCIECPYHGWQFDVEGNITSIPQLEAGKDFPQVGSTYFPTHLAGDVIYAFLPSSMHGEMFPQSLLPEDMFPTVREDIESGTKMFVRELPYSFDFLVENFMDPAHIPFAHHSLQSVRSDGAPMSMDTVVSNFTHIETTFKDTMRGKPRS